MKERRKLDAKRKICVKSQPNNRRLFFRWILYGKSFSYHREKYAIVSKDINEAKVYSSKLRAIKGCEIIFANYSFEVVKIED